MSPSKPTEPIHKVVGAFVLTMLVSSVLWTTLHPSLTETFGANSDIVLWAQWIFAVIGISVVIAMSVILIITVVRKRQATNPVVLSDDAARGLALAAAVMGGEFRNMKVRK